MDVRIKHHGEETEALINKTMDQFRARLNEQQGQIRNAAEKLTGHGKRLETQ